MFKLTVLESELFSNVEVKEYQYQPYTNRDFVTLTLKFTQHALNQLENYFEFEGMVFEEDGWIYITETFPEDGWIYRLLLSLGDHVEVLKPQHIRNKLKDMAKRIFEIY
ncbi:helix-turn-helix transcriptional regulator [Bacillus sp. 2205SS5-2]|uniref:helix-turn-helix transcriptional regulator n=1 Tax=Bacillus sp. 2205SS5-2 TaxID=3109031 RepID=UPI003FA523AB